MPASGAASTMRRTVSTPALWPAMRGNPRARAHRPLPSMMIPVCRVLWDAKRKDIKKRGLFLAHRLDDRFHVVEIAFEGAPPRRAQPVIGARNPPFEGLGGR